MDGKLWRENKNEKFFGVFGWVGRKENKWWDSGVFSPKWREN